MTEQSKSIFMHAVLCAAFTTAAAPAQAQETASHAHHSAHKVTAKDKERHREILERKTLFERNMAEVLGQPKSTSGEERAKYEQSLKSLSAEEKAGIAKKASGKSADIRKDERTLRQEQKILINYANSLKVSKA
jgi:hypothetical protein